jgi:hypothetical protein
VTEWLKAAVLKCGDGRLLSLRLVAPHSAPGGYMAAMVAFRYWL